MELVKPQSMVETKAVIENILKTLVSTEDIEDIISGIILTIEDGSEIYSVELENEICGFFIVTPLSEEMENSRNKVELINIEEIWIKTKFVGKPIGELLSKSFKKILKELKCKEIEIIITESVSWLGEIFQEYGYNCAEMKLEKILPTANNLGDVLELVRDCTPIDRIVQVLFEKDHELMAEIVEEIEEIQELLDGGWIPTIVVVTFEPDGMNIQEIISQSDSIIHWDDYNLIYRGE